MCGCEMSELNVSHVFGVMVIRFVQYTHIKFVLIVTMWQMDSFFDLIVA